MTVLDIIAEYNRSFYRFLMDRNYLHFCENSIQKIYKNTILSESINSNATNHRHLKIINEIYDMYKKDISYYLASENEAYIFVRDFDACFLKILEDIHDSTSEYYETDSYYNGPTIYIIASDCDRAIEYAKKVKYECSNNCYYILFKHEKSINADFYPTLLKQLVRNIKKILIEKLECDISIICNY